MGPSVFATLIAILVAGIVSFGALFGFFPKEVAAPAPADDIGQDMRQDIPKLPSTESSSAPSSLEETEESASPEPRTVERLPVSGNAEMIMTRPETAASAGLSFNTIDLLARPAIVNLVCTSRSRGRIRATSGSGVLIDSRGIVLTNAHVAQFWLLPSSNPLGTTACTLRTATPVTRSYEAQLLYISPTWIREHAEDVAESDPRGTGENDYALLLITGVSGEGVLPASFPTVTLNLESEPVAEEDGVLIAGYPTRDEITNTSDLESAEIVSTLAQIQELFTFGERTLDVIALGGTALSYKGSSGGAVIDEENRLIGIITTSTTGETAAERELRALTLSHIDRTVTKETGFGLIRFLSGDVAAQADDFNRTVAPALAQKLLDALE